MAAPELLVFSAQFAGRWCVYFIAGVCAATGVRTITHNVGHGLVLYPSCTEVSYSFTTHVLLLLLRDLLKVNAFGTGGCY